MKLTDGKGVDKVIVAGGGVNTFDSAVKALKPGGRLRMEKLGALVSAGKLDVSKLSTHVFHGWEHIPEALQLMKDKPADLIKPVVILDNQP